jgi:S1-C subfamily serine protease
LSIRYGFLLTNQHVLEGADDLMVVTSERKKLSARVVKADGYKGLALIKVDVFGRAASSAGTLHVRDEAAAFDREDEAFRRRFIPDAVALRAEANRMSR